MSSPVLQHVLKGTVASNTVLLRDYLQQVASNGVGSVCFDRLLLGDGGYVDASRASLANSGRQEASLYSALPSFFSSSNWWSFRQHAFEVSCTGVCFIRVCFHLGGVPPFCRGEPQ